MTVRREVAISAGLGVLAVAGIGLAGLAVAREVATDEALRQAEQATMLLARAVIEPVLDDDLLTGDPDAIEDLDAAVQAGVPRDRIRTVRVWGPDGTILYTDDLTGIGEQFPLGAEEQQVLATGEPHAELSRLEKDENADQAEFDELLEVYVAMQGPDGLPLLFETYQSPDPIQSTTGRIIAAFAPLMLFGLLLVGLTQALLAWRLARRLERAQAEREDLLGQALLASEHERRVIAADLHDGVVQDLVGLTYGLDAMAADPGGYATSDGLASAAATTRGSIRSLRSLLVEIYPPNLDRVGLPAAVADLATALAPAGITVDVRIDPDLALSEQTRNAVYRAIREGLSNVRRHSGASHAVVRVARSGSGGTMLEITDDGSGFVPGAIPPEHVGLRLLEDLAASIGGSLHVSSAPGRGTTLRMEVPR